VSALAAFGRFLNARASARPLAVCRILVGSAAFLRGLVSYHLIDRLLRPEAIQARAHPWLPELTREWMTGYIALWLVAAAMLTIGYRSRLAGAALTILIAYHLVADQNLFFNHIYFLWLLIFLLTVADSGADLSVDWHFRGRPAATAALWPIVLLKVQVTLVYFFAAVMKLNAEFLSGDVIEQGLRLLPEALRLPWIFQAIAWSTVLAELLIGFGLWSARLRVIAIATGIFLHGLIPALMGWYGGFVVFSLSILGTYPLFLTEVKELGEPVRALKIRSVHALRRTG
jgi:hypothetical protein